jgi:hypothetical protein
MTDLKRWTDEGAPETIERLLRAAESEQPSAASLASALTSLGIAGAVTSATSGAVATGAATSGAATSGAATSGAATGATALTGAAIQGKLSVLALTTSLAQWIALGSVVGGTAIAVHALTDEAPPPASGRPAGAQHALPSPTAAAPHQAAPAPSAGAAYGVPAPSAGSGPAAASDKAASRATRASAARAARPSDAPMRTQGGGVREAVQEALPAETLAQEVLGIDQARSLLAAGRYSATIAALDDYQRRFPKHHFAPEVLYLRMEAVSGMGRTHEARRLAQRLLAGYPTSPQSEKAKHLLAQKIE